MQSIKLFGALSLILILAGCGDDPCSGVGMSWGNSPQRTGFNTVDSSCGGNNSSGQQNPPNCQLLYPDQPNYCGSQ